MIGFGQGENRDKRWLERDTSHIIFLNLSPFLNGKILLFWAKRRIS